MDARSAAFSISPTRKNFPGPRPVIVNIHGGPESQARPGFSGRNNYLFNELGCAMILPERARLGRLRESHSSSSTTAFKREDSYKDISALLDWIKTQPQLDASRVMALRRILWRIHDA